MPQPFIVENILLHDAGVTVILSEGVPYDLLIKEGFWRIAVFFFVKIMLQEDFLYPGIHGKGVHMVKAEKADAVGYLPADAVKAGEIFHGLLIIHKGEGFQIKPLPGCVTAQAVNVFGPVAKL